MYGRLFVCGVVSMIAGGMIQCGVGGRGTAAATTKAAAAARAAADLSTPGKALGALMDGIEAEDRGAVRAVFAATTKTGTALADDMALLWVTNHRFHRILKKHFPDNKEGIFWEFWTEENVQKFRAELATMTFTIKGDTATPSVHGETIDTLVKNGSSWQLDYDHLPHFEKYPRNPGYGGDTPAMMYLLARYSPALEAVAADIEAGKLKTIEEVKKSFEGRCYPILEEVEKELSSPAPRG